MTIERYENDRRMSRAVVAGETVYLCGQVGDQGRILARKRPGRFGKLKRSCSDTVQIESISYTSRYFSAT